VIIHVLCRFDLLTLQHLMLVQPSLYGVASDEGSSTAWRQQTGIRTALIQLHVEHEDVG
jgi:hypothetical protein